MPSFQTVGWNTLSENLGEAEKLVSHPLLGMMSNYLTKDCFSQAEPLLLHEVQALIMEIQNNLRFFVN